MKWEIEFGIETIEKYARAFRLGQKTGVELPGEAQGTVAGKENNSKTGKAWYLGDTLNAAIGQSDNNFSPIQMARYISILTNGGKVIKPTIIRSITRSDGTNVSGQELNKYLNEKIGLTADTEEQLEIDTKNVQVILEGMKSVTDVGGTANSVFKNFNIEVGGKTGSAESNTGDVNAWFVGFAPYYNPEIAVIVIVENGSHGTYTAYTVREIMKEYFGMNISGVVENMRAQSYVEEIR